MQLESVKISLQTFTTGADTQKTKMRRHSKDKNDVGTFTQGIWFTCLRWVSCEHTPDTPPHQANNKTGSKLKSTASSITPLTYRTSSKLTLSFDQGLQHTPCHDRPHNREVLRHKNKDTTLLSISGHTNPPVIGMRAGDTQIETFVETHWTSYTSLTK